MPSEKPKTADASDRELELKVSRLSRELRDARSDAVEARQKVQAHDALADKIARARQDPHAMVSMLPELFGKDFGELADWIVQNEGRFRERQRFAELPPEVREEFELAKKMRMEREESERQEQQRAQQRDRFERYKTDASRFLDENKTDYPLSHAIGWAAGQVAQNALKQGTRDARPLLDELEKNLRSELTEALSSADVVRELIKGDPALADKVRQALGVSTKPDKSPAAASLRSGPNASADGLRSLNNGVAASDVAGSYSARAARKALIQDRLKAHLYGGAR